MVVGEGFDRDSPKKAVLEAVNKAVSNLDYGTMRVVTLSHDVIRRGDEYIATVILAVEPINKGNFQKT